MGDITLKHSFLYCWAEWPIDQLLGWDLLLKLNAQATFAQGQLEIQVPLEQSLRLQMAILDTVPPNPELLPPKIYRGDKAWCTVNRIPSKNEEC